jgi:hypothetical protein
MKLDVIFKVQSALDNRATPHDIFGLLDTTYYSKSKDKEIRLGDMDITHFVRVYNNVSSGIDKSEIFDKIHDIKKQLADLENQL